MQNPYISPEEFSDYAEVLGYTKQSAGLKLITKIVKQVRALLGFPVYIGLPADEVHIQNKPEQLRALRIVKKLQQAGYIKKSQFIANVRPDEPPAHILLHTLTEDYGPGWSGKAAHTSDKEYLVWPALGEVIERYSVQNSYFKKGELVQSSYKNLTTPKVNIFAIAGFSKSEQRRSVAPYRFAYTEDDTFTWVPVVSAQSGRRVYAPWQWFSFQYIRNEVKTKKTEALLTPPITTGAATGQTLSEATLTGLLEVIERDAFIIYWLQQLLATRIDVTTIKNDELQGLVELARDYRLELQVLYLQTDVPVHTICVIILDRSGIGPAVCIDAKTGFDIVAIIIDLLQDQLAQRGSRYTFIETHTKKHDVPAHLLTHNSRLLYWCKSERLADIEAFLAGPLSTLEDLPSYDVEPTTHAQLEHLYDWFSKQNYPIYYREIISPTLKDLCEGVSVVVVKVPAMQPLFLEEQLKATNGSRLHTVPKKLGLATWFDTHNSYFNVPHPFI